MSSANGIEAWELEKAGYSAAMQPESLGDAEPGVEKVLHGFFSLEVPTWLATHRELQISRRIRILFDLLARGLAERVGPETRTA